MTDISHTLFVSDLDGTLLNEHSLVSAESAQILGALIARRGLLFTVATARTPATAVPLLANVGLRLPMVVMEGAAMWHGMENRFVDVQTIDERTVAAGQGFIVKMENASASDVPGGKFYPLPLSSTGYNLPGNMLMGITSSDLTTVPTPGLATQAVGTRQPHTGTRQRRPGHVLVCHERPRPPQESV